MQEEYSYDDLIYYCPHCGKVKGAHFEIEPKFLGCECQGAMPLFSKIRRKCKLIKAPTTFSWGKNQSRDSSPCTLDGINMEILNEIWEKYVDVPDNDLLDRELFEKYKAEMEDFLINRGGYGGSISYTCPKCGFKSISPNTQKQGFSVGKAAVGVVAAGPVGAAAGAIGMNKEKRVCPNCGYKW